MSENVPMVRVGIMSNAKIEFILNGTYLVNGISIEGQHLACVVDGKIKELK